MTASDIVKQAGRLVLGRTPGLELDSVSKQCLQDGTIGGIVIFKQNAESLEQLSELCHQIIKASMHPPVIAVDQEGGAVQRFDHLLTPLPSPMALAATGDESFVRSMSETNARQCKALGINCIFTPSMDVLTNPANPIIGTRSFGGVTHTVSELSKVVLNAVSSQGIVPVGKHFPGHGGTLEDSHIDLAVNAFSVDNLWSVDLEPYRKCMQQLPAIMVGHLWCRAIDEEALPSTLSARIVTGVLRDYMRYDGLIMTDDLTMKAITNKWGIAEASIMSMEAGCDLLLVCSSPEETRDTSAAIAAAVGSGRLSEERIAASIARLQKLFARRPEPASTQELTALKEDIEKSTKRSLHISARGIFCRFADDEDVLPLGSRHTEPESEPWLVVVPDHERYRLPLVPALDMVAKEIGKEIVFEELRVPLDPDKAHVDDVVQRVSGRRCLLLLFRHYANEGQALLASTLPQHAEETIGVFCDTPVSVGSPGQSGQSAQIYTFDPSDHAMKALARVLLGLESEHAAIPPEQIIPWLYGLQTVQR